MKVAIVTGASKGIGKAIAIRLAQENFHILKYVLTKLKMNLISLLRQ